MLFPDDVVRRLRRSWPERRRRELLGEADWPLTIALQPPTEAAAAAEISTFRDWVAAWGEWAARAEVEWEERTWSRIGRQRVPRRLVVHSPARLAEIVGAALEWRTIVTRRGIMLAELTSERVSSTVGAWHQHIVEMNDADFSRLIAVARWLAEPRSRAVYLRELPIPGVHTKWIEEHESLVRELVAALRGIDPGVGTAAVCGLREPPATLRLRLASPELRSVVGGLCDIEAPVAQLACLPISPKGLLVVENLASARALEDMPGVVIVAGLGAAVALLAQLPWAHDVPWGYWGDLDTHGFAILDRSRSLHHATESLLMDRATLLEHRELWGTEPVQHAGELVNLSAAETAVYAGLREHRWGDRVRLEQERIGWDRVTSEIGRWARSVQE